MLTQRSTYVDQNLKSDKVIPQLFVASRSEMLDIVKKKKVVKK